MNRPLLILIALFLLVSPTAAQEPPEALEVSVARANVRDAASMNGNIIFQLSEGEPLLVIAQSGSWYFVETLDGRRAYIHSSVVRVVQAPPPSPVSPPVSPASTQPAADPAVLRNADVIAMAKAGLSEDIIVDTIRKAESTDFDLSPNGLVSLKNSGVSETVIRVMLDPDPDPATASAVPTAADQRSSPPNPSPAQVQTQSPGRRPNEPLYRARPAVFGGFVAGGGEALFAFGGGVGGRPLRNYRNLGIFGDLAFAHSDEAEAWLTLIGAGAVQNFQLEGENIIPYAGAGLTIAVAKTGFGSFEDAAFHISGGIDFPVTQDRLFRVDVTFMFFNETVTRVLGSFVF